MTSGELRAGGFSIAPMTDQVAPGTDDRAGADEPTAADEECRALVDDLCDAVSQALFAATITAEALPQLLELDPDEGRRALQELAWLNRAALDAVCAFRGALRETPRPPTLPTAWFGLRTVVAGWRPPAR